jgi:hypothetical protein
MPNICEANLVTTTPDIVRVTAHEFDELRCLRYLPPQLLYLAANCDDLGTRYNVTRHNPVVPFFLFLRL